MKGRKELLKEKVKAGLERKKKGLKSGSILSSNNENKYMII